MKKLTIALLFLFGVVTAGVAQTTTSPTPTTSVSKADKAALAAQKKADKAALTAQKKADKEAKVAQKNADKAAKDAQKSTGLNKDGSPDKRLKANKQPKVQAPMTPAQTTIAPPTSTKTQAAPRTAATQAAPRPATTQTTAAPTAPTRTQMAPTTKTADVASGTDAKGRTIYTGPRGGHYYIDKNGHKEYVKQPKQ
jgi:colicin import membrane protein